MIPRFADVDAYVRSFPPPDVQSSLEELRALIHDRLPGAGERISYQIPTVTLDGRPVVYFAAWKRHLSLYPVPHGDSSFERDVAPYRGTKDTLRLPLDDVPYALLERVLAAVLQQRLDGTE